MQVAEGRKRHWRHRRRRPTGRGKSPRREVRAELVCLPLLNAPGWDPTELHGGEGGPRVSDGTIDNNRGLLWLCGFVAFVAFVAYVAFVALARGDFHRFISAEFIFFFILMVRRSLFSVENGYTLSLGPF